MQELSPRERIAQVDKLIDANRAELERRNGKRIRCTAGSWQKAWDAHPDLYQRERELFCLRGELQRERDDADYRAAQLKARREAREYRKRKPTLCPTCGQATYADLQTAA